MERNVAAGRNYKWVALGLLFVAFFLHQGTRQIFGAMLPQIQSFFGVSRTEIGVVGTVFQLAYGLSLPFAGIAADFFGRKRMVVIGVAMFCGGIFLGGFAAGVGTMALAYGLMNGLGQSAYYPGTMSLVSQLHAESRATAFSILQCGLYGGILICSVAAGHVAGLSPEAWRVPFWAFGGLGVVWAVVLFFFLRNTPPSSAAPSGPASGGVRAALGSIVCKPCFWLLTLGLGMMIYVDVGFKIWTPTFLRDVFPDLTPGAAALHAVLWHYLGAFCGITVAAKVTDRYARRRRGIRMEINIIGLACAVPFIVLMAKAGSLTGVCIAMGLFGFFRGVYDSNILAALFDVVDPRYHATASSCMLAIAASIGSAAPTVLGWIGDHASLRSGFASLAAFYLIGAASIAVARVFFLRRDVVLLVALVCACGFVHAADGEVVENESLRIAFAAADEGFGVRSVENRSEGVRFVNPLDMETPRWRVEEHENCGVYLHDVAGERKSAADFWELELRAAAAPGDRSKAVFVDNRSSCRTRRMEKGADGVTFVWEGVRLPDGELDVRARIRFDADGSSRWTLSADLRSEGLVLFAKHYPFFRHVVRPKEGDVLLPRADVGARLYRKAGYEPSSYAFGCLAYVPMMTAFMIGDAGLYVAAHDERANAKTLVVTGERDVAFHSCVPDGDFEVTVAAFRGDWWAAARLYRRWALTAPWCRKGRILDRADYPRRLCEIPLWFNFHGDAAAASNALARAKALFPDVTAGLHWHRWQAVPWEIGHYPEYFPEGPGVKGCLGFCRSIGQEPMLYTLPRLYSQTLLSFHFAEPAAIRRPDGTYVVERYGRPEGNPPPLVPLCPAVKAWQDCTVDYARRILALGGRSVFLDQFASCPARACYAEGHGHRPGGGDWFYRGQHEICARVHDDYAAADAFVTAEGSAEQFIDVVDGFLGVTQRAAEDVPFMHAVYNGYTTYFCSPENHEDDDDSFWALQARETLWGQSLGWYHTLLMEHPAKVGLVRRLVAFRQRNLDCFAYGELLGDVAFEGDPVPRIRTTWLGRKSFPDWADPKAALSPTTYGEMAGVLGYVWKSGTTGKTCAIVGNLTNVPRSVAFGFGGRRVELALSPRDLRRIDE